MIDLQLFGNMLFSINLATGFISFVGLAGVMILMPFYLENILGFKITEVGLLMGIVPVMLGITAPFAGALSDRAGTRLITVYGLGDHACGLSGGRHPCRGYFRRGLSDSDVRFGSGDWSVYIAEQQRHHGKRFAPAAG